MTSKEPRRPLEPLGSPPGEVDEESQRQPDIGEEHDTVTIADQLEGGPEGVPEPESPHGFNGMD